MTNVTFSLLEEQVEELQQRASELNLSLEQLLRVSVDDMLAQRDEEIRRIVEYALKKNEELYRRLV